MRPAAVSARISARISARVSDWPSRQGGISWQLAQCRDEAVDAGALPGREDRRLAIARSDRDHSAATPTAGELCAARTVRACGGAQTIELLGRDAEAGEQRVCAVHGGTEGREIARERGRGAGIGQAAQLAEPRVVGAR